VSASVHLSVDGHEVAVVAGTSVAAAVARAGRCFRRSVGGQPRAPLCGMGVCFECRVTIDGVPHERACMVTAREGMEVTTDG